MIDDNFMNLRPFGTFNSEAERELSEEFAPVNNGKMIATHFLDIFTWPIICGFKARTMTVCILYFLLLYFFSLYY